MSALENYNKGIGNRIRQMQLVINSKDRDLVPLGSPSKFRVTLQNPINSNIIAYGLESCTITKSSYNISTLSNTFQVEDSIDTKTVILPVGNYTSTLLISSILDIMNGFGVDTYTLTLNPLTSKLTITSTYPTFKINPNFFNNPLVVMLGFLNSTVYAAVGGILNSPGLIDVSGLKNLYIRIDQLTEYMRDTKNLSSTFKIDYSCNFGSIIYFGNQSKYLQYYTTAQNHLQKVEFFDVVLMNENNEEVDMNEVNWSMVIKFITEDTY